jgi:hypothetical protein
VRDQDSHPYKKGYIICTHILIFIISVSEWDKTQFWFEM